MTCLRTRSEIAVDGFAHPEYAVKSRAVSRRVVLSAEYIASLEFLYLIRDVISRLLRRGGLRTRAQTTDQPEPTREPFTLLKGSTLVSQTRTAMDTLALDNVDAVLGGKAALLL